MPSASTDFILITSAVVSIFGDHTTPLTRPDGTTAPDIGHRTFRFANDETARLVIFDDEPIQITGTLQLQKNASSPPRFGIVPSTSQPLPTFSLSVKPVLETSFDGIAWKKFNAFRLQQIGPTTQWKDVRFSKKIRLPRGTKVFRVCVKVEGKTRGVPTSRSVQLISPAYAVTVRQPPRILTFIAMGGSSTGGSSTPPTGNVETHPEDCDIDPELIEELMTEENIECNDLCAGCMNFIEHLGLRLMNEGGLASILESLSAKTNETDRDYCDQRSNRSGISHRIVLGKWENSEHEPFRPSKIKTFESILDEFEELGGHLLIVAQSHAGAKLAATIDDKWRWNDAIDVELFVAWDATHLGGGITSVGERPKRVVNFYQRADPMHFQNGKSIEEADLEFNLTNCLSHNAIARSRFVHETTYSELRTAIAKIRTAARA